MKEGNLASRSEYFPVIANEQHVDRGLGSVAGLGLGCSNDPTKI
jgi:hypothetical protein